MPDYFTVVIHGKFDGVYSRIEEDVVALNPWTAIKKCTDLVAKRYKQIDITMAKASCRRGYKWK